MKNNLLISIAGFVGISVILIPISAFGIALLLQTTVTANLVLIIAALINLFCFIAISRKRHRKCTS